MRKRYWWLKKGGLKLSTGRIINNNPLPAVMWKIERLLNELMALTKENFRKNLESTNWLVYRKHKGVGLDGFQNKISLFQHLSKRHTKVKNSSGQRSNPGLPVKCGLKDVTVQSFVEPTKILGGSS